MYIEHNFYSAAGGAEGLKNFSVGICDGALSTARSSLLFWLFSMLAESLCLS